MGPLLLDDELFRALEEDAPGEGALVAYLEKASVSRDARAAARGAWRLLFAHRNELPADVMTALAEIAGYSYPEVMGFQPAAKREASMGTEELLARVDALDYEGAVRLFKSSVGSSESLDALERRLRQDDGLFAQYRRAVAEGRLVPEAPEEPADPHKTFFEDLREAVRKAWPTLDPHEAINRYLDDHPEVLEHYYQVKLGS